MRKTNSKRICVETVQEEERDSKKKKAPKRRRMEALLIGLAARESQIHESLSSVISVISAG